ncbi:tetratricopeptide repeat protein [Flavitalea sp. BT771]|uniref:tetratricopeptide repeat protein n=1 Tax=Flavitalea sp. BT771 TaxID=3063329 RepID=UPI0026E11495|nr:tetratricopeptide repeat protein [Flavitalea sp. BT771]MDO6434778.1 tetratricopeptide repeat protein [Flavitalea sp. BT771]MDV6223678.1 tetratricopeptide repeat protein [Flavitalea sp. BT771]
MNKKYWYAISLVAMVLAIAVIAIGYNTRENKLDDLLERKVAFAGSNEWAIRRDYVTALRSKIKKDPTDTKSILALTTLFVQEARITGNYMYYDRAALKCVNKVLQQDSLNFEALSLKSLVYLSQHHFADGLALAEKAQKINPFNAFIYGLLIDGNVEMGHYDSAVANADRMVSVRPDIRSYSRISYLREIHGDYAGAIDAMKMAVDAGGQGDETTEWARIQLGRLYEYTGDLKNAEMHYTIALDERPGYAFAWSGLARVAVAGKRYSKAIEYYRTADSLINDYSIKEEWADAYKLAGKEESADSLTAIVVNELSKDEQNSLNNDDIGHYADRELAYAYLKLKKYDQALGHALIEYNRRPANIDVNETVAWMYYCKKQYPEALPYLKTALTTHSKNPVLLCRAGLIYASTGHRTEAKALLEQGLANDPNISGALKKESLDTLRSLQQDQATGHLHSTKII